MSRQESFYTECLEGPINAFMALSVIKGMGTDTDMMEHETYIDGFMSGAALVIGVLPDDVLDGLMDGRGGIGLGATTAFILESWNLHRERIKKRANMDALRREVDDLFESAGKEGE